jgi:hypothetical protein
LGAVPIAPLGLSDQEQSDLLEFLKTLTGEMPPDHLLSKPLKQPNRMPQQVDDK